MKIYTKRGDKGETSMAGGTRINKAGLLLDAYGNVDELNATIGLLLAEKEISFLHNVQRQLFTIGGLLATEPEKWQLYFSEVDVPQMVADIESEIDRLSGALVPLNNFILPQGSRLIATTHLCRTVCRRAERAVARILPNNDAYFAPLQYLNRLSDFFFILARFLHKETGIPEKML